MLGLLRISSKLMQEEGLLTPVPGEQCHRENVGPNILGHEDPFLMSKFQEGIPFSLPSAPNCCVHSLTLPGPSVAQICEF